jgi:hypothetical protein
MANTDPSFNPTSYIAFDGTSIRDLVISRLNQNGVFTDQNYQGSNLSALIDVIGYTFSTLLYYLNKTSSESMFTETQIYENMNRIVKLLNYNPVGRLGQNVPILINTTSYLKPGNYTIPRYSYLNVGGVQYSVNQDITFTKYTNQTETISNIANSHLAYQGTFKEYPTYTALGIDNEITHLSLPSGVQIDHFNIFVYVKSSKTGVWQEFTRVPDLFLYGSSDLVYEVRFNQNKNYEITFGDNVNGKSLNAGDEVQIFYLQIDPTAVGIAPNVLNNSPVISYNSVIYNQIMSNIKTNQNFLTVAGLVEVTFNNEYPSTVYTQEENVNMIRTNAPKAFRSQYRLVTNTDYVSYVKTNYSNFLSDVTLVSNDDYLTGHLKYLYNIGLNSPQLENRILINQVNFANSCNFNNLYLYLVPSSNSQDYITTSQKEIILNSLNSIKTISSKIVTMDPVYIYMDFYIKADGITPSPNDLGNCKLVITKNSNVGRADSSILSDIQNIFTNTFDRNVNTLGQLIDIYQLNTSILNVAGVQRVQTYRSDTDTYVEGVSLLFWNYNYPENDSNVYTQNINLDYFQYPVFNNVSNITSRIKIVETTGSIIASEF